MKEYCVDLEIAKKLEENKFPQKSYFCYRKNIFCNQFPLERKNKYGYKILTIYSAPTSDEILKELEKYDLNLHITYDTFTKEYSIIDAQYGFEEDNDSCKNNKKLSNAVAKMWLYLKKEGYIK